MAVNPGRFLNLRWKLGLRNSVRDSLASFGLVGSRNTREHTPPATYAQWLRLPESRLSRAVSVIAGADSGLKQERGLNAGPPGLWVTTASDPVGASVFRSVSVVWVSIIILLADPSSAGVSQSDIRGLNSPPQRRYNRVVSFCDPQSWTLGERRTGARAVDICSPVGPRCRGGRIVRGHQVT